MMNIKFMAVSNVTPFSVNSSNLSTIQHSSPPYTAYHITRRDFPNECNTEILTVLESPFSYGLYCGAEH
jgi:hypothetical protein